MTIGTQLHGKTLGVIGAGRIGSAVIHRAQGFGMQVLVHDPYLTDERAEIYVQPRNYEPTVVTNRPRTYGLRYWMRF